MKLIEYDGVDVKVCDEAFLVRSIRELYEEDRSRKHDKFLAQISYMWFMVDPRSPYQYLVDENERSREVKAQEGLPPDWEPSEKLKKAMSDYSALTVTTQSLLLHSMRKGIENVRNFLAEVDLFAVDERTQKPLYQVSTITSALKQVPELAKALADAEKALAKDFAEERVARGNTSKSIDEDE